MPQTSDLEVWFRALAIPSRYFLLDKKRVSFCQFRAISNFIISQAITLESVVSPGVRLFRQRPLLLFFRLRREMNAAHVYTSFLLSIKHCLTRKQNDLRR